MQLRTLSSAVFRLAVLKDGERLRLALQAAGDAVYDWSLADDRVEWIGEGLPILAACTTGAALDALHGGAAPQRAAAAGGSWRIEYAVRAPGGQQLWIEDRGIALTAPDGMIERVVGHVRNITESHLATARLERMAGLDEMTGYLNRWRLKHLLAEAIASASRDDCAIAYLVAGIDNLAGLNATYGFAAADEVIIGCGRRIAATLGDSAQIGRVSGNKLGILLPVRDAEEALLASEAIRHAVRSDFLETGAGPLLVTISVGGVLAPLHAATADDALMRAEEALDKAKRAGRDGLGFYVPDEAVESERRRIVALGEEIVRALEENRITLAFQPVVDATTGAAVAHEALMRLTGPDGGIVNAGAFIPAAEELGLIRLLDQRALVLALDELRRARDIRLSLNISTATLSDTLAVQAYLATLQDHRSLAQRLTIEITESAAIHDVEQAARFTHAVQDAGARIAIDDFGAGYTSFRNLQILAVDLLKIDGIFAQKLAQSRENQAFVRALCDIARALGIKTVAEWVDSADDAALLRSYGVDYFQGFHFGKPTTTPPWR